MRISSASVTHISLQADAALPGGTSDSVTPKREFADLWLRFVSSVAQYGRQGSTPDGAKLPIASVREAARDLATRIAPFFDAASPSRDMWQVVDQVASRELGGAANTTRHRSMAESGRAIVDWLARQDSASAGNDRDLLQAVEHWLAVSGVSDAEVDALSKPKETPNRIDLAQVTSKYIGETEKNLGALFDDAARSRAALIFDEADALFGKRTDVHDSHDRHANAAANHLQQQRESDEKAAVDPDILKRMRALLPFPLPPR
jgi:hypothetical protein